MKRIFGRLWWWTYSMFLPPFFAWAAMEKHEDRRALTTIVALLSLFAWGAMISLFWPLIPTWFWPTYFVFLVVLFFTNNKEKWASVKKSLPEATRLWYWMAISLVSGPFLSEWVWYGKLPQDHWSRVKLFAIWDPLCAFCTAMFLLGLYTVCRFGIVPFWHWLWGGEECIVYDEKNGYKEQSEYPEEWKDLPHLHLRWGLKRILHKGRVCCERHPAKGDWNFVGLGKGKVAIWVDKDVLAEVIHYRFGIKEMLRRIKELQEDVKTYSLVLDVLEHRLPGQDKGRSPFVQGVRRDISRLRNMWRRGELNGKTVEEVSRVISEG